MLVTKNERIKALTTPYIDKDASDEVRSGAHARVAPYDAASYNVDRMRRELSRVFHEDAPFPKARAALFEVPGSAVQSKQSGQSKQGGQGRTTAVPGRILDKTVAACKAVFDYYARDPMHFDIHEALAIPDPEVKAAVIMAVSCYRDMRQDQEALTFANSDAVGSEYAFRAGVFGSAAYVRVIAAVLSGVAKKTERTTFLARYAVASWTALFDVWSELLKGRTRLKPCSLHAAALLATPVDASWRTADPDDLLADFVRSALALCAVIGVWGVPESYFIESGALFIGPAAGNAAILRASWPESELFPKTVHESVSFGLWLLVSQVVLERALRATPLVDGTKPAPEEPRSRLVSPSGAQGSGYIVKKCLDIAYLPKKAAVFTAPPNIAVPVLFGFDAVDCMVYALIPSCEAAAASCRLAYGLPSRDPLVLPVQSVPESCFAEYTSPRYGAFVTQVSGERFVYAGLRDIRAFIDLEHERPHSEVHDTELFHAFLCTQSNI